MLWGLTLKKKELKERIENKIILLNQLNREVFRLEQELEKMRLNQQIVGESLKRDREKMEKMGYTMI